jgi:DNA-binding IclR family transcriptional regulator
MPGNELVQSLARGLDLVRIIAEAEGGLTMPEIVHASGLHRSTTNNLIRTLMSREFVTKSGGMYRIGPAIQILAAANAANKIMTSAEAEIVILARRFPAAIISFCESVGGKIFSRFVKFPQKMLIERNSSNEMLPYQTATGLVVLAFADPQTRQSIQLHHPFQVEGITLWENEGQLENFLSTVRNKGYAVPPFCNSSNHKLAAMPAISDHGRIIGVFGVAWNQNEYDTHQVVSSMREAADRLLELAAEKPTPENNITVQR